MGRIFGKGNGMKRDAFFLATISRALQLGETLLRECPWESLLKLGENMMGTSKFHLLSL
jgi:hypothetical protein